jgi:hypothetical protein
MWIQNKHGNYIWALGRDLLVQQEPPVTPSWRIVARCNPTTIHPNGETWTLHDKFTSEKNARAYLDGIMKAIVSEHFEDTACPVITQEIIKEWLLSP